MMLNVEINAVQHSESWRNNWLYSVQQAAATDNNVTTSLINVNQQKLNDVELCN